MSLLAITKSTMIRNIGRVWTNSTRLPGSPAATLSLWSAIKVCQSTWYVRNVHNTSKKHHTSLITSDIKHSAFHKMSLNALKSECRSRGLKVSGKKAELVDRITSFNGSNAKLTSVKKEKKMSTVSNASKPANTKLRVARPVVKTIKEATNPKLHPHKFSTASGKLLLNTKVNKSASPNSSATISVNATNTKATNEIEVRDTMVVKEDLTWRDRIFLLGFGTVAALWWGSRGSEEEAG